MEERSRRWIAGAAIAVPILFLVIQKASINAASMQPEAAGTAGKRPPLAAAKPASSASAIELLGSATPAELAGVSLPASHPAPNCLRKAEPDLLPLPSPDDRRRVMDRMRRSLSASSDARLLAVASMLEVSDTGTPEIVKAREQAEKVCVQGKPGESLPGCREARESLDAAQARQGELASPSMEKLARSAYQSKDPLVYAMAMQACRTAVADAASPSCGQLSAEQWTQLDPDNGAPWMKMLEQAVANADMGTANEALYRLSQARRIDSPLFAVTQLVLANMPPDLNGEERIFAASQVSAIWIQWQPSAYQPLAKLCSAQAVRDANRAQTCDAVAHLLLERDKTALGNTIGLQIGETLGWPAAKTQEQRIGIQVALSASPGFSLSPDEPINVCELPRQLQDWTALVAEHGEVKGSLEYARRTGRNLDQLRADHMRRMAMTTAARQVPAASAPESVPAGS